MPRGYAVILADVVGTAFSTGCPLTAGRATSPAFKAVIDWLKAARRPTRTATRAALGQRQERMIGKSYDGTLANGVAATGVAG